MIIIGFDKKNNPYKIINYLKTHALSVITEKNFSAELFESTQQLLNLMTFFEVETENLSRNGLCCWGEGSELNALKEKNIDNPILIKRFQRVIDLYNKDLLYWDNFASNFVYSYGNLALFRYYSDLDVPIIVEKINLSEFTQEKLLGMRCNQIFLISKTGDG